MAHRLVIDSNVFDDLADDDATLARVEAAVARGHLELLVTTYQWSELEAIPDTTRRTRLMRLTVRTELPLAVWGVERWGESVWGGEADSAAYNATVGIGGKHYVDAQTVALAARFETALVTADKRMRSRASEAGVPTLTSAGLLSMLDDWSLPYD